VKRVLERVLGLSPDESELLTVRARRELSGPAYALRCAAFVLASSAAGRPLPERLRRKALGSLLGKMLVSSSDALGYVGVIPLGTENRPLRDLPRPGDGRAG